MAQRSSTCMEHQCFTGAVISYDYDYPIVNEIILKDMDKIGKYLTHQNNNMYTSCEGTVLGDALQLMLSDSQISYTKSAIMMLPFLSAHDHKWIPLVSHCAKKPIENRQQIVITLDSEVIMFSPFVCVCLFVCLCVSMFVTMFVCLSVCLCLSRCLSGQFTYEGLVPQNNILQVHCLEMSSCASYISRTHDVIDDVTRWQSRSKFEIYISPSIFELERRSKAQNVGNANGYLSDIFNFRYNFQWKSLSRVQNGGHF